MGSGERKGTVRVITMTKVSSLSKGIEAARLVASFSDRHKHKMGSVITDKNNNIISMGCNSTKSHPIQYHYAKHINNKKIYLHAEISSIIKLNNKQSSKPYRLFVTRLLANGNISMSKPCPICLAAIIEVGIKEIIYTDSNGIIRRIKL